MSVSANVRPASAALRRESSRPAPRAAVPPFRLRFVLLLAVVAWGLWDGYPRLSSAFRLHDATVATANYALCMVGPTGPTLIRDRPRDFQHLVRRRLIASEASERPFARCSKLALAVTGSVDAERAHALSAGEFREYGGKTAALSELAVSAAPLAQLSADAWPFSRGGYLQLIKPSLGAVEAAHVPAPARPALGKGLPAQSGVYRNVWREGSGYGLALGAGSDSGLYVTQDRGLTFRPLPRRGELVEAHAERCASPDGQRVYRLTVREDGGAQQVLFSLDEAVKGTSDLSPIPERVLGSACDERSLFALTFDRERLHLRACPFAGRCGELPLPKSLVSAAAGAVDLAKLKGTLVLSFAQDGVVRTISSRDEGRTFTPPIVAFDAAEHVQLASVRRPPSRLLALGDRLLLYSGGKSSDTYPVLASDDQGVSFRTP